MRGVRSLPGSLQQQKFCEQTYAHTAAKCVWIPVRCVWVNGASRKYIQPTVFMCITNSPLCTVELVNADMPTCVTELSTLVLCRVRFVNFHQPGWRARRGGVSKEIWGNLAVYLRVTIRQIKHCYYSTINT